MIALHQVTRFSFYCSTGEIYFRGDVVVIVLVWEVFGSILWTLPIRIFNYFGKPSTLLAEFYKIILKTLSTKNQTNSNLKGSATPKNINTK